MPHPCRPSSQCFGKGEKKSLRAALPLDAERGRLPRGHAAQPRPLGDVIEGRGQTAPEQEASGCSCTAAGVLGAAGVRRVPGLGGRWRSRLAPRASGPRTVHAAGRADFSSDGAPGSTGAGRAGGAGGAGCKTGGGRCLGGQRELQRG